MGGDGGGGVDLFGEGSGINKIVVEACCVGDVCVFVYV